MMNMQQVRRKAQKGFTLIELMIVVAIIGILAAVAIPQYRDYTTKSRWAANVAAVSGIQQAVAQCLQENAGNIDVCGTMQQLVDAGNLRSVNPPDIPNGAVANGPGAGEFNLAAGVISITGGANAGDCIITMTPDRGANAAASNSLTWTIRATGNATECTRQTTGFNR